MPEHDPMECQTCGDEFIPQRKTAKFCSAQCRYRWNTAGSARQRIPDSVRFQVLERDRFRCRYCGKRPGDGEDELRVDHLIPVAEGGALTAMQNLVTACHRCNSGKGDLTLLAALPPIHASTPVIGVSWDLEAYPAGEWMEVTSIRLSERGDGLYDLEAKAS